MRLTFTRFRANLRKVNRRKHVEKESTSVGTLQRDFRLFEVFVWERLHGQSSLLRGNELR